MSKRRYLHIHGDESTARDVLRAHIARHKGAAFLIEGAERNVTVAGLKIDPNRMWSREGAEASLRRLNPAASIDSALARVEQGRARLLGQILPPAGGILIALHNNARGYSVNAELEISEQKSIKMPASPHEFFLATGPGDYATLAASPYNVVLQQNPPGPDDGSMSRLCAKRGIRYVNLECALGNAKAQTEMIEWAEAHLKA